MVSMLYSVISAMSKYITCVILYKGRDSSSTLGGIQGKLGYQSSHTHCKSVGDCTINTHQRSSHLRQYLIQCLISSIFMLDIVSILHYSYHLSCNVEPMSQEDLFKCGFSCDLVIF